jgi:hypothetical protein
MKISALAISSMFAILAIVSSVQAEEPADGLKRISAMFQPGALVGEPKIVDCTLSGGTKTSCYSITVTSSLKDDQMGPWCPRNIADSKDVGGIWLHDGEVKDVDGKFIENLATFYNDDKWKLFDSATGKIRVTDSKESCSAAARPDVDPAYQNHCVECLTSYMGEKPSITYVIPVTPANTMFSTKVNPRSGIAVAFNGIKFDAPAPVNAILGAYTVAPFDDCGGHVNLHVGYHYHAVRGCEPQVTSTADHAPKIGLALDGYGLFARANAAGKTEADLDSCGGHETAELGYHYHAGDPGANQILGCFKAEIGCSLNDASAVCDATKAPKRP